MTSSSDAPAASSTVSMFLKVCSVCSARSSLTTLPVFGSKPPWPDRKIHSPTVSPGEYGPGGAGSLSELIRAFMDRAPPRSVVVRNFPRQYTYRSVYRIIVNATLESTTRKPGSDWPAGKRAMYTDRYVYYGP